MSRSFITLLLILSVSSCTLLEPIITVSSDAYTTEAADKYEFAFIYIDPGVLENDLSKRPYYDALKNAVVRKGHRVVNSPENAELILSFDVTVVNPTVHTDQSISTTRGSTSTETRVNPDGTHETVIVKEPDIHEPTFSQSYTYDKVLTIKLKEVKNEKLIWQATSTIDNRDKTYAPYATTLVYDGMKYFLRDSQEHPVYNQYGTSERDRMKAFLSESY